MGATARFYALSQASPLPHQNLTFSQGVIAKLGTYLSKKVLVVRASAIQM